MNVFLVDVVDVSTLYEFWTFQPLKCNIFTYKQYEDDLFFASRQLGCRQNPSVSRLLLGIKYGLEKTEIFVQKYN